MSLLALVIGYIVGRNYSDKIEEAVKDIFSK